MSDGCIHDAYSCECEEVLKRELLARRAELRSLRDAIAAAPCDCWPGDAVTCGTCSLRYQFGITLFRQEIPTTGQPIVVEEPE